jgi:methyl-accepting chemotaxis protein
VGLREAYEEQFSGTVEELEAGDRLIAVQRMSGKTRTTLNALLAETARMAAKQQESMALRQTEAVRTAQQSKYIVVTLGFGALLAGVLMAVVMTRSISNPLGTAVMATDRIASGDLGSAVPEGGSDEVGQLLASMHNMRQHLRSVISTIHQSSTRVGQAAESLSQQATEVKHESQAQSLLAAKIEQSVSHLASGIGSMVVNAQATREHAHKARNMSQQGSSQKTENKAR